MNLPTRVSGGLLLVLVITAHACTFLRGAPYSSSPLFMPDAREAPRYQALAREQDQLLGICAETHTCDRAHFIRALLALYENQAVAARHFQNVIDAAPKSRLASSSQFWLQFLQDPPTILARQSPFAESTERLVRDLLEMETSSAQAMHREVKARDKKVEELTTQLEALKRIDQEMKEITRPVQPSLKTPPPADKGNQP
jgi:hypothetical protein